MNRNKIIAIIVIAVAVLGYVWAFTGAFENMNKYKSYYNDYEVHTFYNAGEKKKTTPVPSGGQRTYFPDNSDPYNAKDYDEYEEFYDDHWDDFFDIDDAEDYWRENHDK